MARGKEEKLRLDLDRMAYWRSQGAQVSPRVAALANDVQNSVTAAAES